MSFCSRAYKILCARYRDVLLCEQNRRRRRDCQSVVGCGDPFSKLERLESRVLFTTVTSVDPLEASHAAMVSANLSAIFDEGLDNATVSDQSFVVHGQQSGRLLTVNGDIASLGATDMTVTLNPAANFHPGELVQATITGGIQSTTLTSATPFVWQFRAASTRGSGVFGDSDQSLGNHQSFDVTLGDLDGDGDLDAFVANRNSGNRVWLNDGSGNFSDSAQSLGNHWSLDVTLGDVDGDGDLDAFVANRHSGNRVWLNDGSGNFTDSTQSLGTGDSRSVILGDVDGDGDLDAFVANRDSGNRVWLNNGSGNFTDSSQSLGNGDSRSVILGDVDSDGDLDAFVANMYQSNRVWLNNGSGSFTDSTQSLGTDQSYSVTLGDLDGDGDLDAFVANINQGNRVWFNDGSANFANSTQSLGNHFSSAVTLGDVDGDGDLDAFVANYGQGNRVWLNDGSGNFVDSTQSMGNHRSLSVTLGDVDGDGDLDAFVANYRQSNRVWFNRSADLSITKTSNQVAVVQGGQVIYTIVVSNAGSGNVTGATVTDTFPDQLSNVQLTSIVPTGGANSSLSTGALSGSLSDVVDLPNGSSISYTVIATVVSVGTAGLAVDSIVTNPATVASPADFPDNDLSNNTAHDSDIVVLSVTGGSGVFDASDQSRSSDYSRSVTLGDLDGDGDLDAFVANRYTGNGVWLNDGSGNFNDSTQVLGNSNSYGVTLGDLDGDGDLDAFVANRNSGNRVWLNDGSGNFSDSEQILGSGNSYGVTLGDVDGDGDLDAFVANYQGNYVWLNDGSGNFTDSTQRLGNGSSRSVSLGDVDGDGDLDVFVANTDQANRVWLNDGNGNLIDSTQSLGSGNSFSVTLGDLDGDGDLDAFVANRNQGNRVWFNDGSGNFSDSGQALGDHNSYGVTLGDLDGDGDLDAFVANSGQGGQGNRVWLNDSSGNFTDSTQILGNHYSFSVTLGDVDGDGDLDAFVANGFGQGNRVWVNQNAAAVAGRHIFYNNSGFDGDDGSANVQDDQAIATDKQALLPEGTAQFRNYTSFDKGINGIMIDIQDLAVPGSVNANDFAFLVGNSDDPSTWSTVANPMVEVREGEGDQGSDRVTLIWPDGSIMNQWLQVRVKDTVNTGLAVPDVFYFGHVIGETGDNVGNTVVNVFDVIGILDNRTPAGTPAGIENRFDFNRDDRVDVSDFDIVRSNVTVNHTPLSLITVPAVPSLPMPASAPTIVATASSPLDVNSEPAVASVVVADQSSQSKRIAHFNGTMHRWQLIDLQDRDVGRRRVANDGHWLSRLVKEMTTPVE